MPFDQADVEHVLAECSPVVLDVAHSTDVDYVLSLCADTGMNPRAYHLGDMGTDQAQAWLACANQAGHGELPAVWLKGRLLLGGMRELESHV